MIINEDMLHKKKTIVQVEERAFIDEKLQFIDYL